MRAFAVIVAMLCVVVGILSHYESDVIFGLGLCILILLLLYLDYTLKKHGER